MKDSIKILFLEDVPQDSELIWKEISKAGILFEKKLVDNRKDYISALKSFEPELIISDYSLPQFDGLTALTIKNELAPSIPFILVTGSVNEEIAVEIMKAGADDYVIKQNLSRLGSAIDLVLKKAEIIKAKEKIQLELEKSEALFSAFLEYCPVYFFFKDNEARPIRLSRNYEQMLGRPITETLGKTMFELFPKDVATSMVEDDLNVIRNKVPVKVQENLDGRIFETIKFPIKINEEQSFIAGFTMDITEQKRAEKALKESEERFKILFEKAPIGYQSLDFDGNFIEVNETWLEMLGYSREEVLGKWFGSFLASDYVEAFRDRFPLFKEWGKVHSEFGMLKKDGSSMTVAFDGRIGHTPDGAFKQTHCVLEDVTELRLAEDTLRESEARFHLAVENSPVPIMIHDEDDKILMLSNGWTVYSGYTIEDIPTMGDWTEAAYGKRTGLEKEYIDNLFNIWKTQDNGEWTITAKDGSIRIWEFHTTPLGRVSRGKRVLHSLAIDITEQKKSEETLKQKIQELEKFNDLTVGRELKMIDLKKEVNELLAKMGEKEKYKIVE